MSETDGPVVLVVEDEPDVAETYELWLAGTYDVRLAASGTEALELVDDAVDVVLLDRMMPGMSGDEVLAEIREQGYDVRVAMVTAVDPDFDIVEMGFDDYVTKPPTQESLRGTVEDLLARGNHVDTVQEYRALLAKRTALEAEKGDAELAESDAYADLQSQIEAVEAELDDQEDRLLDDSEFVGAIRDFEDGAGDRPEDSG
ncbi:response regulator [Natronomonas salina]|uniref:response regulator n=1 Tax=Natronomonas salina TaxID=1710540 RepID=UPI0015B59DDC|nr:response regulator [Natronomonas salina]QLD90152.1 response regulator [Natronomonas salina]